MSNTNTNLFTLNPKFFQTASNNFHSCLNNTPEEFSSTKSIWNFEKTQLQDKVQFLENDLKTQKEINKKLIQRIQELENIMNRTKNKEHQRVYSTGNLANLSPHNILNSILMSFPDHKHKKTPFISTKFMEDLQNKNEEDAESNVINKENEAQAQEKRKLHHQKSNSFNTKSLVIVETTNHEQKTDFTTIHVNIQEGVLSTKNSIKNSKHLFNQKKTSKKPPTTFESNSNSTNLSNSNISLSGMSSYEVKNKPTEDLPPTKPKDRFSIITSEKSVELNVESNEFMKRNVANCYIFMSPAQRQKLISTPLRRKWIAAPKDINVLSSQKRSLKKDFLLTKSTQNLMQPNMKNLEKHRGTHLYRQSPVCLNDLKLFGSKKQYNPQSTLKGHLDGVRSLALSNDNSTLISASEDYSLKLWDIKDIDKGFEVIEPFCTLRDHKGPIFSVASANSLVYNSLYQNPANLMFSAGADGKIRLWTLPKSDEIKFDNRKLDERSFCSHSWKAHDDCIWDITPDFVSGLLTSCSSDGYIKMWRPFANDGEIELFDFKSFDAKLIGSFKYASNDINDIPTCSVWINNQNQGICSGFVDFKGLVLFDYAQKEKIKSVFSFESEAKDARANKILFDSQLNCLISAHEDRNMRIFDLNTQKIVKSFTVHNDSVTSLSINQKNPNQVISVSHDGSLRVWDLRKFQCLQDLLIHRKKYDESVHCVLSNKHLPYVFTGGADACIKVMKSLEY